MNPIRKFLRWLQRGQAPGVVGDPPLRGDLKPGTLFRYLYADCPSRFTAVVPPRHPDAPVVACCYVSDNPGPGDLLTAVEVLWEPE